MKRAPVSARSVFYRNWWAEVGDNMWYVMSCVLGQVQGPARAGEGLAERQREGALEMMLFWHGSCSYYELMNHGQTTDRACC